MERVFSASHPDPVEIDKARKVLKVRQPFILRKLISLVSHVLGLPDVLNIVLILQNRNTSLLSSMPSQGWQICLMVKVVRLVLLIIFTPVPYSYSLCSAFYSCCLFNDSPIS